MTLKVEDVRFFLTLSNFWSTSNGVKPFPVLTFPTLANTTGSHEVDLSSSQPRVRSLQEPESPTPKRGMDAEREYTRSLFCIRS